MNFFEAPAGEEDTSRYLSLTSAKLDLRKCELLHISASPLLRNVLRSVCYYYTEGFEVDVTELLQ